MTWIIIGILLLVESVVDIRTMQIAAWRMYSYIAIAVAYRALHFQVSELGNLLWGIAIGLAVLGIGRISGEAIGYGDGIVILILGILLGGRITIVIMTIASGILMLFSMGVVVRNRFRIKHMASQRFAMIPFLCLGYIGGVWLCL